MTPENKKKVIIGVAVAATITVLYFVLRRRKDNAGADQDPTGNGNNLPGSVNFNAYNVAMNLYEAMKDSGTNEDKIFTSLLPVRTEAQFAQVIQKFGELKYNPLLGNQTNLNPFTELKRYNLKFWLENELSEDSYETLRLKYPNYL